MDNASCPRLSGKVAALADERGKCERIQKNENSVSKNKNTKMTHTKSCPLACRKARKACQF